MSPSAPRNGGPDESKYNISTLACLGMYRICYQPSFYTLVHGDSPTDKAKSKFEIWMTSRNLFSTTNTFLLGML